MLLVQSCIGEKIFKILIFPVNIYPCVLVLIFRKRMTITCHSQSLHVILHPNNSDVVLEYSTRTRVQLEYHFLSTRTRTQNPRYSAGTRTRRSMYSVLGQKKSRVHEYIWPSLKVINKMNI